LPFFKFNSHSYPFLFCLFFNLSQAVCGTLHTFALNLSQNVEYPAFCSQSVRQAQALSSLVSERSSHQPTASSALCRCFAHLCPHLRSLSQVWLSSLVSGCVPRRLAHRKPSAALCSFFRLCNQRLLRSLRCRFSHNGGC